MNKKIILSLIITIIILLNSFNRVNAEEEECSSYSIKTGFSLYKERVRCLCKKYEPEKSLITIEDDFLEIEYGFYLSEIGSIHRDNMNNIYKCGMLSIQEKSFLLIKDIISNNPDLGDRVGPKIDEKIFLIKLSGSNLGCNNINEENSILKLNVLKQVTYETCRYINYLEYIKKEVEVISVNISPDDNQTHTINELFELKDKQIIAINEEIEHTYKVFPIAYEAYSEYENNIVIHFLLELIKEDYIILREKLHKVLNPINQVVYKISNAMRKE